MPDLTNFKNKIEKEKSLEKEKSVELEKEKKHEGAQHESARENEAEGGRTEKSVDISEQAGDDETAGFSIQKTAQQKNKEQEEKVEKILSKNLGDIYLNMSLNKQKEFKKEGEKTTKEINSLLNKTKIKIRKIISLIKKWLAIIPGINKFFLEQESKIKADEIMKIKDQHGK